MSFTITELAAAKKAIRNKLGQFVAATKRQVTVGIHADAGVHPKSGITNAQLGALLNYGNPHNTLFGNPAPIPPRPWLVPGVETATQDIADTISHGVANDVPMEQILEQVGLFAVGGVQQYMTDLKEPSNSAYTVEQKGSDNPLIDTGALRASVTYKVENGQ